MEKPVLVILAAGMGSRYGGLKQIDTVGNNGESIIDFSIYDAIEAGFEKVVLIIRKEHEEAFRKNLTDKISKHIEVEFAYQDLNDIPEGISVPEGREKPWGTTHALLACRDIVKSPFAILNADDFYGKDAYKVIYNFLLNDVKDYEYGMVGYLCNNTLTDFGSVTRGVCEEENGYLKKITEIQKIARKDGEAVYEEDGEWKKLDEDALVSMNFWGFTPMIFKQCNEIFEEFIKKGVVENPMKSEHVIPTAIGDLVESGKCSVKMLSSKDKWFGVTYREDKPMVEENIQKMKDENIYPFDLWK
ncbi:MAG: nucleotidyltransferase [Erysipelotrichaceae bacterium]|nr:nucleotidyltransferase [Erysipelotrichaceae bacterium]